MGNLLTARLLSNKHVLFAAYRTPHPLFAAFDLRVQTDGTMTPKAAVIWACSDIVRNLNQLAGEFTKEMELKKISRMAGGEDAGAPGPAL